MVYDIEKEASDIIERFSGNKTASYHYVREILTKAEKFVWFWKRVKARIRTKFKDDQLEIEFQRKTSAPVPCKKLTAHEKRIFDAMVEAGTFTNTQIKNKTGLKATDISPRTREFKRLGMISPCGQVKNNRNRAVIQYKIND